MHAVKPNQQVRILTIQIAVAADADPDSVADEMSELLSENGICSECQPYSGLALSDRIPTHRHSQ